MLKRTKNVNKLTFEMLRKDSMLTYNHMQEEGVSQNKESSKFSNPTLYILFLILIAGLAITTYSVFLFLV